MATKTFSEVKGGYRSSGTSITLVSNKVLSSTNPVRINSVTVSCGVGSAYGKLPYISDTTTGKFIQIGSYVNSSGSTVNMLPDGGWFFYPSSSTTISPSSLTKYTSGNYEYYKLSGYGGNFAYADGAPADVIVSVGNVESGYETISNIVYAKYAKCGTVGGDSTKVVYGVTVGSGAASKTFHFNPDMSEIAAGEAVNVQLHCLDYGKNGVLCVPSGSTVTIDYTEIAVDNPSSGNATGTVTFVAPGSYSTSTTTLTYANFSNYYSWEYVSFPANVPTISGSCDNYTSYGYKYPSLQNIVSVTMSRPTGGADNLCVYNGELYYNCPGPDDISSVTVTYRTGSGAFPGSITAFETGLYAQTITLNSPSTSYSLSSAASPEFIAGSNALVFPEISGWHLQVVPDNLPNSTITKYATYTKIQNTTINISGLSNNYNVNYTTLEGAESSFTSNGTYTVVGTVTINRAYDNGFSETGVVSYEDNNVINIEFRKDRRVDVFLVQQYESYMREPFVSTILTINFSNGQSQSITLNYNRNGPDMEATGVATHTYTNATVTSYYVFGKTYTTGITNGNDASISNVVELIDLGPWRQVIPYIYLNGQWVKYEDTRLYNGGWKKATWRIYSDASATEGYEEEPNAYGTTAIISNYTTEQNSYGTTVVIE